ncbi:MAG: glycerophosphodiester phosphodiesterase family protein [Aliishimia sp.]
MISLPESFLNIPLAHRALHDVTDGRPENSRAAIQAAIKAGYGIEIDVQLSFDGAAMVFHDDVLDRLTDETGAVRLRPASQLREIGLSGGAEGIPDLPEILELVSGRVPLLIEIKDQDGAMGDAVGALETAVAQALTGYEGPVGVMSFNPHSVALMADIRSDVARGLVTSSYDPDGWGLPEEICANLRAISDYDRVGASFISHELSDLGRDRVRELKANGADILSWTIKSEAQEDEARKIAQGITFEGYLAKFPA